MALFSSKDQAASTIPSRPLEKGEAAASGSSFIGRNVVFEGTLSGDENVIIEGTVKGKIAVKADVRIGPNARIEAEVHAKNVAIEGRVNGNVSADNRVELVASANVDGNLKAPKIVVSEGAQFRGNVDMGSQKPNLDEKPKDEKKQ